MKRSEPHILNPGCSVVILAAGKGKRMGVTCPKPLVPICGKPALQHLLDTLKQCDLDHIFIVHPREQANLFKQTLDEDTCHNVQWVEQAEAKGTGHAVQQALPFIKTEKVIVLLGDTPFVSKESIQQIKKSKQPLSLISCLTENPFGLGRIIRDEADNVVNIIEEKDLEPDQKAIKEVNTGIIAMHTSILTSYLHLVDNCNNNKEYYLTAILPILEKHQPGAIECMQTSPSWKVCGANTMAELAALERKHLLSVANQHLANGVRIKDPHRFDCLGDLSCGKNVVIDINVIIKGRVSIGNNCTIGAGCILDNVTLEDNVSLHPHSLLQKCHLARGASIGPFAYCRENTQVGEHAQVGCFVETKSTTIGKNSKAKHLSYLGNLEIGERCNIGAGVIHCNYDGQNKYTSIIKNDCFIGADSQIIGPVTIEESATIAAGATVTKRVPKDSLAISRPPQANILNWKKKLTQ